LLNKKDTLKAEKNIIQIGLRKESRRDFIKEVMKIPGGEKILDCIQCGSCSGGCPTMFAMDYSPMQIIKMINLGMKKEVLSSSTIWICSACYTCTTRCPRNVDFPTLMMSLRNKAIRENLVKDHAKSNFHKSFFEVVNKYGRMNESRFFIKLVDITDLTGLLHNIRLGLRLLRRGKIQLRTSKIDTSSITEILEKIEKEEHH
jgi:heterodisulfide reductase subunit C